MHPFRSLAYQRQDNDNNRNGKNRNQNTQQQNKHVRKKDFSGSYYAYGKSAAIEFSCDETKKQKINTITLHAASARVDSDRGYDWENKSIIQLPRHEMLAVTAVLLGMLPSCEYRQSGAHSSKSYKVEYQGSKVFFMIMERGKPIRAVGLSPEDTYHVVALFVRQLRENSPWMSVNEIVQMIEMTMVRMSLSDAEEGDAADAESEEGSSELDDEDWDDEDEEFPEPNFNC